MSLRGFQVNGKTDQAVTLMKQLKVYRSACWSTMLVNEEPGEIFDPPEHSMMQAIDNSPGIMAKNVGQGSQYLWAFRDAAGHYLDGAKNYRVHIPSNIPAKLFWTPAKMFWSVLVYDTLSRSQLQIGRPFPAESSYTIPLVSADGWLG
jgi:hypothetical protein